MCQKKIPRKMFESHNFQKCLPKEFILHPKNCTPKYPKNPRLKINPQTILPKTNPTPKSFTQQNNSLLKINSPKIVPQIMFFATQKSFDPKNILLLKNVNFSTETVKEP